jgi:AAA domain, putative AbiEii toxin, Type IV TA system
LQAVGYTNQHADTIRQEIAQGIASADSIINQNFRHNSLFEDLQNIARTAGKPLIFLNQDDFRPAKSPSWGKSQPFQQHFGKLFCQYAELQKENALNEHYGQNFLDKEAFAATYMMPPWDFVNETLRTAGLDFEINQHSRTENTVFTPRLKKTTTGDEIQFGGLSSSERVIMSFALCMYYAGEGRQLTTYPRLLLLDEIDAPLHPSMVKHFLTAITEVLVKKLGVNVIATTHSPSTVALAPDDAIHVMKVGSPGVHKITKADALNLLTAGVPTISIDYAGRRQVFVESPRDAEMHCILFQVLRDSGHIKSVRSLEFVSTGSTNQQSGTDQNTGSSNVKLIVSSLVNSGNKSVFGFIDWDGHNGDEGRVLTLCQGESGLTRKKWRDF